MIESCSWEQPNGELIMSHRGLIYNTSFLSFQRVQPSSRLLCSARSMTTSTVGHSECHVIHNTAKTKTTCFPLHEQPRICTLRSCNHLYSWFAISQEQRGEEEVLHIVVTPVTSKHFNWIHRSVTASTQTPRQIKVVHTALQ